MAATLKRGIGKLGQRTGELLGRDSGNKTDVSDEFKDLQLETDSRHSGTESTQAALILYTTQLLKKKDATDNSKQKLYLLENLGSSMVHLGVSLPRDSNYGRALEQLGQTEERMNDLQLQFVNKVKEGWLSSLQRAMDDFKEYVSLQKKLESRRSDYDSKLAKYQKSRKDSVALEDELRTAQVRYEDNYDDMARRMMQMQDSEQDYLLDLFGFYEAQLAYHKNCFEQLDRLRGTLDECLKAKRTPAAERNPIGGSLGSRRSGMALRTNDATGSARHPIPFGIPPTNPVARTMSQRDTTQHYRNGSGSQYSDISDDAQAQYNYAHGVDSTVDTGALEGNMALPQGSARQIPQLARVQSDIGSIGRRAPPPPVAPRRHAPAPPMPQRAPRRVLRKTIYKFSADDEGELPMDKGDIVEVTDRIDDGWWHGKLVHSAAGAQTGNVGLFPANYTEDCEESDVPPPIPSKAATSPSTHQRSGSFQGAFKPPTAHRSQTTPDDIRASPNPSHQRTASNAPPAAAAKQCACGCNDYSQNVFKGSGCTNCFHNH
ncbi:hypothetical protein IW146_004841 [Coemansia sp. RSA 922]|nr:hypothetical protein H4S04_004013 [Coemansia sp. S16]KAJ2112136.1 hypothetical protein IW146_004841 [Coemansia sp. RSA 922]